MSNYQLKIEVLRDEYNTIKADSDYFELNSRARQIVDDLVALFEENMGIMQNLVSDVQNIAPDSTYYTKEAIDERVNNLTEMQNFIKLELLESADKDSKFQGFVDKIVAKINSQIEAFESAKKMFGELNKRVDVLEQMDKDNKILAWQNLEYTAEFIRQTQNTGVMSVNNTSLTLPRDATEKGIDTRYSVLNIHNHPNYARMPGMGWFSYNANGFLGQTRHNDYRLVKPSVGFMETVANEAPSVPNYNFTVENMQFLFKQYLNGTLAEEDKELFRWDMSYLESWWQEVDTLDDYIDDSFDSFRHTFGSVKPSYLANRFTTSRAEGKKARFENIPFIPIASRNTDSDGNTTYAVLMYRIVTYPMTALNGKRWDEILEQKEDLANLARSGTVSNLNAKAKFRLTVDFDSLIETIPSLGGLDEEIITHRTVDGYNMFTANKLSNYHRRYSLQDDDAVGRRDYVNGWNDPTLVTGLTNNEQVINGVSYLLPLEMILRTPLETWNPNDLELKTSITGSGTLDNPFNGFIENNYNYHTPAEFFDGFTSVDPADTGVGVKAIKNIREEVSKNVASGIYIVLPKIATIEESVRIRFPINWKANEFSIAQTELEAYAKKNDELLDFMKLNNLTK